MKHRKLLTILLSIALFSCLICFACITDNESKVNTVHAAAYTQPKYTCKFDYGSSVYKNGSYYTSGGSGTKKSSASVLYKKSTNTTITLSMTSDKVSGTGTYTYGDVIKFNNLNFSYTGEAFTNRYIYLKNNSGKIVAESYDLSLSATDLPDDYYMLYIELQSETWTSGSDTYQAKTKISLRVVIDKEPPEFVNASTVYPGPAFRTSKTISLKTEAPLGVDQIYMKKPGESSFTATGKVSITLSKSSYSDGVYSFYATDKAGNQSPVYYAVFDNTQPIVTAKTVDGDSLETETYINKDFYIEAEDPTSGIDRIEYTKEAGTTYVEYVPGTIIDSTCRQGKYTFRAINKAGETSVYFRIYFDTEKPVLQIQPSALRSQGPVSAYSSSLDVASYYVKKPNSSEWESYTKSTKLSDNGQYEFYCVDKAGNNSTIVVTTVDTIPPTVQCLEYGFGETASNDFTITSNDDSGEATTLYYSAGEGSTSYRALNVAEYLVPSTWSDNIYNFYAKDDVGNKSEVFTIQLYIAPPNGILRTVTDSNKVAVVWDDPDCVAVLNNNDAYESGQWVTTEGSHTVKITNKSNRVTKVNFSITHYYVNGDIVAPTCMQRGYTIKRCISCSYTYRDNYTAMISHTYSSIVIEPKCLESGYTKHICNVCGHNYIDSETNPLDHNYVEYSEAATCISAGKITFKCSRCESSFSTESGTATGHNYFEQYIPPTCTQDGGILHTCVNCNLEYISDLEPATGHNYETYVIVEPTCTNSGQRRFVCLNCNEEHIQDINPLGHNYLLVNTKMQGDKTTQSFECSRCGDSFEKEFVGKYEGIIGYIVYLFEMYSPYIWIVFGITAGLWSIVCGVGILMSAKSEDKLKAKKKFINYLLGLIIIAVILVGCPYLMRGIAYVIL